MHVQPQYPRYEEPRSRAERAEDGRFARSHIAIAICKNTPPGERYRPTVRSDAALCQQFERVALAPRIVEGEALLRDRRPAGFQPIHQQVFAAVRPAALRSVAEIKQRVSINDFGNDRMVGIPVDAEERRGAQPDCLARSVRVASSPFRQDAFVAISASVFSSRSNVFGDAAGGDGGVGAIIPAVVPGVPAGRLGSPASF